MRKHADKPYQQISIVRMRKPSFVTKSPPASRKRSKNLFLAEFELNKKRIEKCNKLLQALNNVKKSKVKIKESLSK